MFGLFLFGCGCFQFAWFCYVGLLPYSLVHLFLGFLVLWFPCFLVPQGFLVCCLVAWIPWFPISLSFFPDSLVPVSVVPVSLVPLLSSGLVVLPGCGIFLSLFFEDRDVWFVFGCGCF